MRYEYLWKIRPNSGLFGRIRLNSGSYGRKNREFGRKILNFHENANSALKCLKNSALRIRPNSAELNDTNRYNQHSRASRKFKSFEKKLFSKRGLISFVYKPDISKLSGGKKNLLLGIINEVLINEPQYYFLLSLSIQQILSENLNDINICK